MGSISDAAGAAWRPAFLCLPLCLCLLGLTGCADQESAATGQETAERRQSGVKGPETAWRLEAEALEGRLLALEDRFRALELATAQGLQRNQRLMIAMGIHQAVLEGRPFATEIDLMARIAQDETTQAILEVLRPYALKGVLSLHALREALNEEALVSALWDAERADVGYWEQLNTQAQDWLAGTGLTRESPLPLSLRILEEAKKALGQGDLPLTLSYLALMEGKGNPLLAPWLQWARDRQLVDEIVQKLILSSLTAPSPGSGSPASGAAF